MLPIPEPFTQFNEAMKGRIPRPRDIVEANFELTGRLLAAQKAPVVGPLRMRLSSTAKRPQVRFSGSSKKS